MIANLSELATVSLIGLAAASSVLLGTTIGLNLAFPKRVLAWILAFAAGVLISAFAIKLADQVVQGFPDAGLDAVSAWALVAGGFAVGAMVYYWMSRALDAKGAAIRYPARFRKYALQLKQYETKELIELLPKCDLLRHLPPEKIEEILPFIQRHYLNPGEILFRAGDPGDALYIVAQGTVEVLADNPADPQAVGPSITELGEGHAFGEMAVLSGGTRTATVRAVTDVNLLQFDKADFEEMIAADRELARAAHRLSHERATYNLRAGGPDPSTWADIAHKSLSYLSHSEENRLLARTGRGATWAIVLGNTLDFVPAALVIGSMLGSLDIVAFTLMLGIFLGGIPGAAASAEMLRRTGYGAPRIFAIWLAVPVAAAIAAAAGRMLLAGTASAPSIFAEAAAGGAVLALVAREMIPEAFHHGGSPIVLPLAAGFLFTTLAAALL